jgi:NAD(P)-dependent dehydrogenase (short-subunit alcohol dehydrogenase family)
MSCTTNVGAPRSRRTFVNSSSTAAGSLASYTYRRTQCVFSRFSRTGLSGFLAADPPRTRRAPSLEVYRAPCLGRLRQSPFERCRKGVKGTIIFTNASAALRGFPSSGTFAMACHAKSGLAQSMARELMPQGIHVANVPIDVAIGWTQEDGTRAHRLAGTTVDDNMADRIMSPKPIPSCTTSIGRRGRLRSYFDRGSRSGDRRLGGSVCIGSSRRKRSLSIASVREVANMNVRHGEAAYPLLNDCNGRS